MTKSKGTSKIRENIFENRFMHVPELNRMGVKIKVIGNLKQFPKELKLKLNNVEKLTKNNKTIQINMALNYGSKQEIIGSVKKLIQKKLNINEKNIEKNLYTYGVPDPEILIRTGNTNRISNFLMWQLAYTELLFTDTLWPDFDKECFYKAIVDYQKRERRFGKTTEQLDENEIN